MNTPINVDDMAINDDAPLDADVTSLVPYVRGNYVNGHEDLVEVERADGEIEMLVRDERDPRWQLVVQGDPTRNIDPLQLSSMPIELLRERAIRSIGEAIDTTRRSNITVKGRVYGVDGQAYEELRTIVKNAGVARDIGIAHSATYTCADNRTMRITGPEFTEAWIAIQDRESDLVALRASAVQKLQRVTDESQIKEIVDSVAAKIAEMTGV